MPHVLKPDLKLAVGIALGMFVVPRLMAMIPRGGRSSAPAS
jgi:hypothetical protein